MTSQTYGYDAVGVWTRLTTDDRTCWHYWQGGRIVNEVRAANGGGDEVQLTWLSAQGGTIAEQVVGPGERLTLLAAAPDIDVLLSDLMLPGRLSGAEVVQYARQHYPELALLLTSGQDLRPTDNPALPDVELLRKPFTRAQLAQALRKAQKR